MPPREFQGFPIKDVANLAAEFQSSLDRIKHAHRPAQGDWYPHDTLGELYMLDELLQGEDRDLSRLLLQGPVLDLCCGDGDLTFFLDSQGCAVDAADWPPTNYNGMDGVRTMREALNASVQIEEIDLNRSFCLPRPFYNTVFFMGALYHLKNPLMVLEELAMRCAYCILTTRVTRFAADRRTELGSLPVAYLVDKLETNEDSTNFWIFTPAGLHRILERANWRIAAMMTRGAAESDPASAGGDERAYCFLKSAYRQIEFLQGVHPPEPGDWRWTEREFSVRVWRSALDQASSSVSLFIPEVTVSSLGPVTVSASANGIALPPLVLRRPGVHKMPIPLCVFSQGSARVDVALDRALPPDEIDQRERGLVLSNLNADAD